MTKVIELFLISVLSISTVAQILLFHYLKITNEDFKFLSILNWGFELFTIYDKNVKQRDERIKKIRNILLRISGYCFVALVLYVVFSVWLR